MCRISYLALLFFLTVVALPAGAQVFKYIDLEDGLSSRRVLSLKEDGQGYVWILTHKGVDRYDGSHFTHYPVMKDGRKVRFFPDQNVLKTDAERNLWEIGRDGCIFRYDVLQDSFRLAFDLHARFPQSQREPVTNTFFDSRGQVWFNTRDGQYVYDTQNGESHVVMLHADEDVKAMAENRKRKTFYLATQSRIFHFEQPASGSPVQVQQLPLGDLPMINYIYYHNHTGKLVVNSLIKGMQLYDVATQQFMALPGEVNDMRINTIVPYYKSADEVLIATDGTGVYKLNLFTLRLTPFLQEDFSLPNLMNGNIVKDLYIDNDHRIWTVIYPTGITVYTEKYPRYEWVKHVEGNPNTLTDNRINGIMRDSEGDVWFATSNGISCYHPSSRRWSTYLSSASGSNDGNHVFLSLFEASPGVIIAGGYMSGVYRISKHGGTTSYISQRDSQEGMKYGDKYIRSICRDRQGTTWVGGSYFLTCYDGSGKDKIRHYKAIYPITNICEKDARSLWVGTNGGLYVFDKEKGTMTLYNPALRQMVISTIFRTGDHDDVYVGTYGNGFFVLNPATQHVVHYRADNSGLSTDNIFSIVPGRNGYLFLGTADGLTQFDIRQKQFVNWGSDQGLMGGSFNQNAGVNAGNGTLIFGGDQGVLILPDSIRLHDDFSNRMVFSDLSIMYHIVHPQEKGSPLTKPLNDTPVLHLKYDQNSFSMHVSSINYDNPSEILYSWKLEGFYNHWSVPSSDGLIRYTNLSAGHYTLRVRALMSNNKDVVEERLIHIIINRPPWLTVWAFIGYILLMAGVIYGIFRYQLSRRDRRTAQEKIDFFIHTAHDIRTPLTLIKAPLGEILKDEQLSERGLKNINLAIQNTDNLSHLANNLMNFEKEELYSSHVTVSSYELNEYLHNYLKQFEGYAARKGLRLVYKSHFEALEVWLDCTKTDSILRNLLTNAFKYTPSGGTVTVEVGHTVREWTLSITDTGIGIPKQEQKNLFKRLFRASNAVHAFLNGSGVGLLLTYRLVKYLEGQITFTSTENVGTCFKLSFPICSKRYLRKEFEVGAGMPDGTEQMLPPVSSLSEVKKADAHAPLILIVEDDVPLRNFLLQNLSDLYRTEGAENGAEALEKIKQRQPDLVLSDVMMPVMDGHELCLRLKENIETSHIPIILLTALGDRNHILSGLEMRADMYIVKPFDLTVLKANISNVLENRELLRQRYRQSATQLPTGSTQVDDAPATLDEEFLQRVTHCIKQELGNDLTIDTLCGAMNMGRTSFYNKIKALTGMAPADFVRNIRMQEAALLLKSRRYTVAEVSDRMGFADPKYFTDTFKKFYGVPPSVYMKRQGKDENS